jgi:hypothetical protein
MPLYWLCYRHNNSISVVIEPGSDEGAGRLLGSSVSKCCVGMDRPKATSTKSGARLTGQADYGRDLQVLLTEYCEPSK